MHYIDVVEPEPHGESAAWSRRYAELQPRLVRALAATAGNYVGVEDALQKVFAAALSADRDQISNLGGWLTRRSRAIKPPPCPSCGQPYPDTPEVRRYFERGGEVLGVDHFPTLSERSCR